MSTFDPRDPFDSYEPTEAEQVAAIVSAAIIFGVILGCLLAQFFPWGV